MKMIGFKEYLFIGFFSGLLVGTLFNFILDIDWLWVISSIIGFVIGLGYAEQDRLRRKRWEK